MKLYQEILKKSNSIDEKFENIQESALDLIKIIFNVPRFHPRADELKEYILSSLKINDLPKTKFLFQKETVFIIDKSVSEMSFIKDFVKKNKINPIILKSTEDQVKTKPFLDKLLEENKLAEKKNCSIIVIGGGLLINIGTYLAERISANLILFPTTVLSMADSSGGKVRVNFITPNRAYKHFYKSFYEPNAMFLDDRFLDSLPEKQIKIGLVEIIKHGLFQSPKLYGYLLKSGKDLFRNKKKLKKAILWAADLKRVCLDIDVEENENGSRRILRGGHDFSDRLEEDLKLKIPHGIAVAIGIIQQLEQEGDDKLLNKAKKIFNLFEIPYTLEQFKRFN